MCLIHMKILSTEILNINYSHENAVTKLLKSLGRLQLTQSTPRPDIAAELSENGRQHDVNFKPASLQNVDAVRSVLLLLLVSGC